MADALNRLRESTTTLAGAASTIGAPTPTDPMSAATLGASPHAAQMAGTPANKLATLRESIREESTQGLDQKQEQHDKETLLSQRLKNDAQIAATTGLLTDRVSQKNAESLRASLMVTPVENLLPADIKADTLIKGAVNSFLSPTATAQEKDTGIRNLIKRYPDKLSYDALSSASSIGGLTSILRAVGVQDVSEEVISKSIVAAFPSDRPINETLTPSNSANWEAVFGPGASPTALQNFLTSTGANPTANWAELGPKLKEWQQNRQQDWTTLQEQSRSTNNAVRMDAQEKLRQLGYLGVEPAVAAIGKVTEAVTQGGSFKLGDVTFDTAALRVGDVTQKEKLKDLLTQATLGKLTDKTLEGQIKDMLKSGTLEGLIDVQDIAPIKAIEEIHASNQLLFKPVNPDMVNGVVSDATAQSYLDPALYEALKTATRVVSPQELPAWMQTVRAGGKPADNLNKVMSGAGQYPELKDFIKKAIPHEIASSQLTTNPEVVLANFAGKYAIQNALASVQAGNVGAIDTLGQALVGNVQQYNAVKSLPAPWGLPQMSPQGIPLGADIVTLAQSYLTGTGVMGLVTNPTIQIGVQNSVKETASVANNASAQAAPYLDYLVNNKQVALQKQTQTLIKGQEDARTLLDTKSRELDYSIAQIREIERQRQVINRSAPDSNLRDKNGTALREFKSKQEANTAALNYWTGQYNNGRTAYNTANTAFDSFGPQRDTNQRELNQVATDINSTTQSYGVLCKKGPDGSFSAITF